MDEYVNNEIPWKIIKKMINSENNFFIKHHLDSYNTFFNKGLMDVFKNIISEQEVTIEQLQNYITDSA